MASRPIWRTTVAMTLSTRRFQRAVVGGRPIGGPRARSRPDAQCCITMITQRNQGEFESF